MPGIVSVSRFAGEGSTASLVAGLARCLVDCYGVFEPRDVWRSFERHGDEMVASKRNARMGRDRGSDRRTRPVRAVLAVGIGWVLVSLTGAGCSFPEYGGFSASGGRAGSGGAHAGGATGGAAGEKGGHEQGGAGQGGSSGGQPAGNGGAGGSGGQAIAGNSGQAGNGGLAGEGGAAGGQAGAGGSAAGASGQGGAAAGNAGAAGASGQGGSAGQGGSGGQTTGSPLVINEIDYDQPGADTAEFVEIHNHGTSPLSLDGLALVFINGAPTKKVEYARVDLSGSLPAGGYLVVGAKSVVVPNGVTKLPLVDSGGNGFFIQNGDPDGVILFDKKKHAVVDAISYGGALVGVVINNETGVFDATETASIPKDTGSGSVSRIPNGVDTNDGSKDFSRTPQPTPGAPNK